MSKRPAGTPGKKPRAPSAWMRPDSDLTAKIAREVYMALERLGADEELLAVIGSWCDTLGDAEAARPAAEVQADRATATPSASRS